MGSDVPRRESREPIRFHVEDGHVEAAQSHGIVGLGDGRARTISKSRGTECEHRQTSRTRYLCQKKNVSNGRILNMDGNNETDKITIIFRQTSNQTSNKLILQYVVYVSHFTLTHNSHPSLFEFIVDVVYHATAKQTLLILIMLLVNILYSTVILLQFIAIATTMMTEEGNGAE